MPTVKNSSKSIGRNYPVNTGRLKIIEGKSDKPPKKAALLGDSTIDNGYWVENDIPYAKKTEQVTHQVAIALANQPEKNTYEVANFAVDGATTTDLLLDTRLNKVLPTDADHTWQEVHQLQAVAEWQPEVVVLSVGGNNYREALAKVLLRRLSYPELLFRVTPDLVKPQINNAFQRVQEGLLNDYKLIIDTLIENNPNLGRLVILSQYYPAITELEPYFIYTGFSHLARAEGTGQDAFEAVENTMNTLYQDVLKYVASKSIEIIFVDMTSSLNPLGGNHTLQIEPNGKGAKIMGRLIAKAISEPIRPDHDLKQQPIIALSMAADETTIQSRPLNVENIENYRVKKINDFISENRYRHFSLLFAGSSSLFTRYECAYRILSGNQFEQEYTGLFDFGLLDLSLVTVVASYLWRVAVNENIHLSLRIIAGTIAAPILLCKLIVSLSVMALLALPIYGYHKVAESKPEPIDHKNCA